MILQTRLPYDPFASRALPGIRPLGSEDWLIADEAYAAQIARRAALLAHSPAQVLAQTPGCDAALAELFETCLTHLPKGFTRQGNSVITMDGTSVQMDPEQVLHSLGHLLQEDLCVLEKRGDQHVMTAALVCFPASWTLSEKIGRPLDLIHAPVAEYDATLARRVQRLFDGIRPEAPLWRFNALWYADPELHQPRSATAPRPAEDPGAAQYFRSERQCMRRLPKTGAVVFSIHTYVLDRQSVTQPDG